MAAQAKSRSADLTDQAKFVFQGTVSKVKASNVAAVTATDRTVVVRVDQIIRAPEALVDFAGHEITVQLAPNEIAKPGQALVFFTNGWVFGEVIAVQSVGHQEATKSAVASLSSHPGDPVRSLAAREATTQATAADLIVSGRVSAVRLPAQEATARAAVAAGGTSERISEHAPIWHEAVIDVDEVHQGAHKPKQVVVRFPSSNDVRWYKAPKFHAGQEGVFLLHKGQLAASKIKAAAVHDVGPDVYTALDPADVQPLDELPRIMAAARAGEG